MDRCPNCGSTVRLGAKFCTTCGFRLPTPAAQAEPTPPSRSPFDITSTAPATPSRWPASSPSRDGQPSSATEASAESAVGASTETSGNVPSATGNTGFGNWPSFGSGSENNQRNSWPGSASPSANSLEGVGNEDANAKTAEPADLKTPDSRQPAAGETTGSATGVIDLHALAAAENAEDDSLAGAVDDSNRAAESTTDSEAPAQTAPADTGAPDSGEPTSLVAPGTDVESHGGAEVLAGGESGTSESVSDYLARMNSMRPTESVTGYLARIGGLDSQDNEDEGPADESAEPSAPEAAAASPASQSNQGVAQDEQPAQQGEPAAGDAETGAEPTSAGTRWTEQAIGGSAYESPVDTDDAFDRIFDTDVESARASVPSGEETSGEQTSSVETDESNQPRREWPTNADVPTAVAEQPADVPADATTATDAQTTQEDEALPSEGVVETPLAASGSDNMASDAGSPAEVADTAPAETGAFPEPRTTDPAARAAELLAELQALLPQLSNQPAGPAVDVDAIANALAEQRGSTVESEAIQSLRATIATAQARPRDVDVMLDLVAKSPTMAELLATHDRFARAIDDAIAALRGEAPVQPPPRW